jgi:CBS domain containing-hemolysin-like protein
MTNLLVIVLLLVGNAFFVGGEFSLISSRRTVIEPQAGDSQLARLALRAMEQIPLMIAGAQLGVTVCQLALGAIAEPALAGYLRVPFDAVGMPEGAVHPVAFVLALGIVASAHTILGEMVPKNLTLAGPERAVLWLGPPMLWFCMATKPLLVFMRWAARQVLRIWRIEAADAVKTVYTAEELAGLVAQARTEGLLDQEEHARITGALALHDRTAADAMRPWSMVTTVAEDVSPATLEVLASRSGLSRFPVVARESRRVRGFVHVKDVLAMVGQARRAPIPARLIRPLPVIPPDRSLAEALLAMRKERRHIVLVADRPPGPPVLWAGRPSGRDEGISLNPIGLLTLDDVLRAVVGARPAVPVARSEDPAVPPA